MVDKKLTELDTIVSVTVDDLIYIADSPSGSSDSKKITVVNLVNFLSADKIPNSPNADDDEFNATLSGSWTALGTPDINNSNTDFLSHYHIQKTASGAFKVFGIYKTSPSTPFTVSCKVSDTVFYANYQGAGLFVAEASPGKLFLFTPIYANGQTNDGYSIWTNLTTRASYSDRTTTGPPPRYLRFIVASSTNITILKSYEGYIWSQIHTSINPGFTIGQVGLCVSGQDNSVLLDSIFDWIRFT